MRSLYCVAYLQKQDSCYYYLCRCRSEHPSAYARRNTTPYSTIEKNIAFEITAGLLQEHSQFFMFSERDNHACALLCILPFVAGAVRICQGGLQHLHHCHQQLRQPEPTGPQGPDRGRRQYDFNTGRLVPTSHIVLKLATVRCECSIHSTRSLYWTLHTTDRH